MDRATVRRYDELTTEWIESSSPEAVDIAAALGRRVTHPIADLGCGPGWHLAHLGPTAFGLDASGPMAASARHRTGRPIVQADLEHLPFASGSLGAAWAAKSYVHLRRVDVPMAWRELHRCLRVGAPVGLQLFIADKDDTIGGRKVPGRLFNFWTPGLLTDVLAGAGFEIEGEHRLDGQGLGADRDVVTARRAHTLADAVGPNMRVLVCGLNPSLHAADAGYGFSGPSNRFWPAALDAGLVDLARDPVAALRDHGVGMTDLVKRATARAQELRAEEYRRGLTRLERLCAWLEPRAVCIVGITGWRAATGEREATLGWQRRALGGRPVYVMPNPSGLNAHTNHADLVQHFTTVLGGVERAS